MTGESAPLPAGCSPELSSQTVVVIGASSGIGLEVGRAMPALIANLALELAPTRVNLIAPGSVDTPLSASLLEDQLDARRDQLRATRPSVVSSGLTTSQRAPCT